MNPAANERFIELLGLLFSRTLTLPYDHGERQASRLPPKDADVLTNLGICAEVAESAPPTRALCIPFTVIQEKLTDDGIQRHRRFILWTRAHNFYCRYDQTGPHYEPNLPDLQHISNFLLDVHHESATLRDMRLSFWQVEIPTWSRALYRFYDTEGRLFEMCRLPMGHTVSPELMQLLASVAVGDDRFCLPEFSLQVTSRRVWIDNIRLCGSVEEMHQAAAWLDDTAAQLDITWNADSTADGVTKYDFLGGEWNHDDHSIRASLKHRTSLAARIKETLTFGEAETLIGRLIHFSGMLQLVTAHYYWAMKWFRRKANAYNRGLIADCEQLELPPRVSSTLAAWAVACRGSYSVPRTAKSDRQATLFTDASLQGWGAILVTPDSEVHATGGAWNQSYASEDICALEAKAVAEGLSDFGNTLARSRVTALHIVVDNTSVVAAVRKGRAKSDAINEVLASALQQLRDAEIAVTVRYISTSANPADSVSRGREPDWASALGEHERRGLARAAPVLFTPLRT